MFWSKIWFFLVALGAAVAMTIALVMPRPAQHATLEEETTRLRVACVVVDVLLADNARNRVELVGTFARESDVEGALADASGADKIDDNRMKAVRAIGQRLMKSIHGAQQPAFAIMIDKRGRVVARVGVDEEDKGDTVAGRPLIDDALAGYLRDDLWVQSGSLFFVSASPVVKRDANGATYVGAVVLGYKATNEVASKLVISPNVNVGFFVNSEGVATSTTVAIEPSPLVASVTTLAGPELAEDCRSNAPVDVPASGETYRAIAARLPGEAGKRGAFFSVFTPQPSALGFMGTIRQVTKSDLSPGSFPWPIVGGGFLLALVIGIALMLIEADRPLRRLTADSVRLAKGETDRLSETAHGGKFGSIARSVNIHVDKLSREAKSAKKDFDQLLGPAPEGSLGTIDLLAGGLPPARSGTPSTPPPPSEFKFQTSAAPQLPSRPTPVTAPTAMPAPMPMAIPQARAPSPPVARPGTPPPMPGMSQSHSASSPPLRLDDDILGPSGASGPSPSGSISFSTSTTPPPMAAMPQPAPAAASAPGEDPYFKSVFDQFVAVKKSCNEPTTGLTYAKFADKLVKNRDDLKAKTGCREVRFTVYVKDGKAALKATPVKDD